MIESLDIKKDVEEFINEAKDFMSKNRYISYKEYTDFFDRYDDIIRIALQNKDKLSEELYEQIYNIHNNKHKILKKNNDKFVRDALIEYQDYFDNMFKHVDSNIKLDEEQRKAILTDEDNVLVLAGAGSGKTTTMAAKVKYLIEKCGVKESEIAVISFTNKATDEIKYRIQEQFGFKHVNVMTFHKLGLKIIRSSSKNIVTTVDEGGKYKIISNYIKDNLFKNKKELKKLIDAFGSKLSFKEGYSDYETFKSYHDASLKKVANEKGIEEYINDTIQTRRKYKKTINGDYVKSKEEVDIANFLYINGIDYQYEKEYEKKVGDNQVQIPDFKIWQGELENNIEHFGISDDLIESGFDEEEHKKYVNIYHLKRQMHKELGDRFICTFSKYTRNTDYIKELEKELINRGYVFIKRTDEEVLDRLRDTSEDAYFRKFIDRIAIPFIDIFKSRGYSYDKFIELKEKAKILEISDQVEILEKIYLNYQEVLRLNHRIDFADMINHAYKIMPKLKEANIGVDYNYLIIDEYQDISMQRYNLMKRLSDLFGAKILAVGDDWQAIYGFSGASIDLFLGFKIFFPNAKMLPIINTYRNGQELIDIAGDFILKNQNQMEKHLISNKHLPNPVEVHLYDDAVNFKTNMIKSMVATNIIKKIYSENPKSKILIMGRYNSDIYDLIGTELFSKEYEDKITCKAVPKADITYLTVHKSKGLGFDNCILINVSNEFYGFPSQIEDEPIIKLINPIIDEGIMYPEERRLFYVALTRTKNKIYLLSPKTKISSFVLEIKDYENVILEDEEIDVTSSILTNYTCNRCGSILEMFKHKNHDYWLYKCHNNCGLITTKPKIQEMIDICPICGDYVVYKYTNGSAKLYKCLNCKYKIYK